MALVVGKGDIDEVDLAAAVDEVDRARPVDDLRLFIENLDDALRRGRCGLRHHHEHPEHHERHLQHDEVGAEGDEAAERDLVVDDEVAAVEQQHRHRKARQVLQDRRVAGLVADLFVEDIPPAARGPLEERDLARLGGEGLDDAGARHVLLRDGRDVREARLEHPGDREEPLPHAHPDLVDERQRRAGNERQQHVHLQHEDEGGDKAEHRDRDHRPEREEDLDHPDVGVAARDELAALDPVVEGERQAAQMLEEGGPQMRFDLDRGAPHPEGLHEAEQCLSDAEREDRDDVGGERRRVVDERGVDRAAYHLGDRDLHAEHRGGGRERPQQHRPVRPQDRQQAADPTLAAVRVDAGIGDAKRRCRRLRFERRGAERAAFIDSCHVSRTAWRPVSGPQLTRRPWLTEAPGSLVGPSVGASRRQRCGDDPMG